jgi:hypothetical protein
VRPRAYELAACVGLYRDIRHRRIHRSSEMRIGVVGTGRMGLALARRWAAAGHEVFLGSRDAAKGAALAADLPGAQGGSSTDAVAFADVLVLAVPYQAAQATLAELGDLGGRVLIDITNDFDGGVRGGESSQQMIQRWAGSARTVKAFNTVFYTILEKPQNAHRSVVFITGDDAAAKTATSTLVRDAGFEPVDAGDLTASGYLDAAVQFIVHLGYQRGLGTIAWQLVHE